jgi:hypothetical protein
MVRLTESGGPQLRVSVTERSLFMVSDLKFQHIKAASTHSCRTADRYSIIVFIRSTSWKLARWLLWTNYFQDLLPFQNIALELDLVL